MGNYSVTAVYYRDRVPEESILSLYAEYGGKGKPLHLPEAFDEPSIRRMLLLSHGEDPNDSDKRVGFAGWENLKKDRAQSLVNIILSELEVTSVKVQKK